MDCVWGPWSTYSTCSKSCGGGRKSRTRQKDVQEKNGGLCEGTGVDKTSCNTENCPSKLYYHFKGYLVGYV